MIPIRFRESSQILPYAQNAQALLILGVMEVIRLHPCLGIEDTVANQLPFLNVQMKIHVLETNPKIIHMMKLIKLVLVRRDTLVYCAMNAMKIMGKYRNMYVKRVRAQDIY